MPQGGFSTPQRQARRILTSATACAVMLLMSSPHAEGTQPNESAPPISPGAPVMPAPAPDIAQGIQVSMQAMQPATAISPAAANLAEISVRSAAPVPAAEASPHGSTGLLGLHSDINFAVLSAPRLNGEAAVTPYQEQVKRISASLQTAAQGLYPDAVKRIGAFDVYVAQAEDLSALSSGTGKIAVNAGFARLNPTDDWMAFVIAREMGHIVVGHHDSNAGASLAVSILMNLIVPGSGLLKSAVSFAGSQMASGSGREKQIKEADEAALKLMEAAGYTTKAVALNLRLNPLGAEVSNSAWATAFRISAARLTGVPVPGKVPGTAEASAIAFASTVPGESSAQQPQFVALPAAAAQVQVAPQAQVAPQVQVSASRQGGLQQARWQPEEVVRARPSGLPGPLLLGGYAVPARLVE